jgi:NAD(P)-dependent dehydrogenase (short-subunit alcohol dehydrogenase family)
VVPTTVPTTTPVTGSTSGWLIALGFLLVAVGWASSASSTDLAPAGARSVPVPAGPCVTRCGAPSRALTVARYDRTGEVAADGEASHGSTRDEHRGRDTGEAVEGAANAPARPLAVTATPRTNRQSEVRFASNSAVTRIAPSSSPTPSWISDVDHLQTGHASLLPTCSDNGRRVPRVTAAVDLSALFSLDGRVAVVTGASSGLGDRFARVLHAAGAKEIVAARRKARLGALASELPGTTAIACDVSETLDRERVVAEVIERCGGVDILVNNAGLGRKNLMEEETLDWFRGAMELNVTAMWHLSKLAGAHRVPKGSGSIVNVASMLGLVGSTPIKQAHYSASKGAVINLTREVALQWARKGVRVNALCPGWFESEMTAGMESDEGAQGFIKQNSPIPRMGYPHELDGALVFLCSDASSFMTGQLLVVDGGWTAR